MDIERISDIMEFLIVLKPDDYVETCMGKTYAERIEKLEKDLPGILHCVSLDKLNDKNSDTGEPLYIVRDMVIPYIMYVKLPKEGIYVKPEEWEYEYLKSQIQEIIHIFGLLGAKQIVYDVSNNDKQHIEMGAGISAGDLPIGFEASISAGSEKKSQLSGTIQFPEPLNTNYSVNTLINDDNIHYLGKKFHWQQMVRNRLQRRVTKDDFNYFFSNDTYFNADLSAKIDKIGIGFKFGQSSLTGFNIHFRIDYHPIKVATSKNEELR